MENKGEVGDNEYDSTEAVCPNCKYEEHQELGDTWARKNDGDRIEWECPKCKAKCDITMHISVNFETELLELPPVSSPTINGGVSTGA